MFYSEPREDQGLQGEDQFGVVAQAGGLRPSSPVKSESTHGAQAGGEESRSSRFRHGGGGDAEESRIEAS